MFIVQCSLTSFSSFFIHFHTSQRYGYNIEHISVWIQIIEMEIQDTFYKQTSLHINSYGDKMHSVVLVRKYTGANNSPGIMGLMTSKFAQV